MDDVWVRQCGGGSGRDIGRKVEGLLQRLYLRLVENQRTMVDDDVCGRTGQSDVARLNRLPQFLRRIGQRISEHLILCLRVCVSSFGWLVL